MTKNKRLGFLTEGAIMIAIATVLSFFKADMPYGGGLTVCSMLPLVIICFRHGTLKGLLVAFTYSVLQMLFGLDNVAYGENALQVFLIIALDYIVAYTVIGFAGVFNKGEIEGEEKKNVMPAVIAGIVFTFTLRLACHFVTGGMIWDVLWPNEFGLSPYVYSIAYNGFYMVPEMIITSVAAILINKYVPDTFKRQ